MGAKLAATDRKQLCKIAEGRFQIIGEQLQQRLNDIRTTINDRIIAENDEAIKETEKLLIDLKLRKDKLADEQKVEIARLDAEYQKGKNKIVEDFIGRKNGIAEEHTDIVRTASEKGLSVEQKYNGEMDVKPKNLQQTVGKEYAEITKQYDVAKVNLRTLELETLEKISVAALEADEAKEFLGEIPNIDNLLPPISEIKQLQSAK